VVVGGGGSGSGSGGQTEGVVLEYAVQHMNHELFLELMEMMR
jgi:hypothetical protein